MAVALGSIVQVLAQGALVVIAAAVVLWVIGLGLIFVVGFVQEFGLQIVCVGVLGMLIFLAAQA